jgi:DNA-binding response OmpR family regulator
MRNELSDQYDVVEAADGVEGETMAQNEQPDVVISDVMMPRRDGFELCYRLKNDVATSSIPIILLSARTDKLSEMKGYENRADVYLTKPFNLGILLNRIDYLINRQAELQQEFKTALETDPKKLTISPLDETLLTHILSCVEANITNTDYGIAELSRDVNMSRMNLYRKLQAITGQTPTDFVKMVRLKKAALMLREGKHTIVEVAYAVGYSSPSYFTRSFKSEFGLTPSQYIETLQGGNDPLSDS